MTIPTTAASLRGMKFASGDRVVHRDSKPWEYDTVFEVCDSIDRRDWIVTVTGNSDFADNFRHYDPKELT